MATFTRVNSLSENLSKGVIIVGTDVFKWVLSNSAPTASGTLLYSNITEISNGNGYTTGGLTVTVSESLSTAQTTWTTGALTLTASGAVGPFSYAILVDTTPTSPLKPVIGFYTVTGGPITMANTNTYAFPASSFLTVG